MSGDEIIYLDYNGTTAVAEEVYKAVCSALKSAWANPSSNHSLGVKAKRRVDDARQKVAYMLGAEERNVIFTSGGTEGNNMVIRSAIEEWHRVSDQRPHVITTNVEHDATLKLLDHLCNQGEIELTKARVKQSGELDEADILGEIKANTCLITVMTANNETGVLFPISAIGSGLKAINKSRQKKSLGQVLFHTDAAQAIGKIPVSLLDLNVDYITVVGHKFHGPRVGAVVRSPSAPLSPLLFGGGQEFGLRPGTENTPMIAGLGIACELVSNELDSFNQHMTEMRDTLEESLKEKFGDDVVINFETAPRLPNTTSARFFRISGSKLLQNCCQVVASTGAACHSHSSPVSSLLSSILGEDAAKGTIRLSVGRDTSRDEVQRAVELLHSAYTHLVQSELRKC